MTDNSLPAAGIFKRPRPLDRNAHRDLVIDRQAGYAFARGEIAVPVTLSEFTAVARDYPIVFTGQPAQPFVLLGLRQGSNLLVDAAGQWRAGRHIPAHLRRYPFVFTEVEGSRFVLCIDEAAEHFATAAKRDPQPLFADGQPAPLVGDALAFLAAFQSDFVATRDFAAAIAPLLIDRKAEGTLADGTSFALEGFRIVDEEKFAALPDATILDWRRRGWLAPIHFHLQSLANFAHLADWAAQAPAV